MEYYNLNRDDIVKNRSNKQRPAVAVVYGDIVNTTPDVELIADGDTQKRNARMDYRDNKPGI